MFDGLAPGVQIFFVGPREWPAMTERVYPHIVRMAAGSGGRFFATDIASLIAVGRFHLWLAIDGTDIACTMVTEFIYYPRMKALRIVGLVGHRPRRWLHLLHQVEQCAHNEGCSKIECLHFPGHERMLRTGGWRLFHCLAEKDLV